MAKSEGKPPWAFGVKSLIIDVSTLLYFSMSKICFRSLLLIAFVLIPFQYGCREKKLVPERIVAELNIGESQDIKLTNGDIVNLRFLGITEIRDSIRDAIRAASVKVSVDGHEIIIGCGNYNLPVVTGKVQIDCPALKSYMTNASQDSWGMSKDARFRLWPKGSPYIQPGTFVYPVRQKWFAGKTQAGNEPCWGENPAVKSIYYHAGFDIGGAEGINEIVSATDGLVISAKGNTLEEYKSLNLRAMGWKDAVYILDRRGWFLLYAHLDSIDTLINAGDNVKMGQKIGFIGKQSTSGGWVHLHFDIRNRETLSGNWWTEDAYVYAWDAYIRQYKPSLVAVARPHELVLTGTDAILDGSKSKSFKGEIVSYEWTFSDGTTANGAVQKKSYQTPGEYSEILKVTDSKGNVDYDFAAVEVIDSTDPGQIPYMHASYYPTIGIKQGDPVTFLVRTFFRGSVLICNTGEEIWDFGDGSPQVNVKSEFDPKNQTQGRYAETIHSYSEPGHYIVSVRRTNECGFNILTRLHIEVNK